MSLTDRKRETLELIARHETTPEIARRLHLSQRTVRNHASNILTKLQVADRAQAILRAREAGLGQDQPRTTADALSIALLEGREGPGGSIATPA